MKLFRKKDLSENEELREQMPKDNLPAKPGIDYFINQVIIWTVIAFLFVLVINYI